MLKAMMKLANKSDVLRVVIGFFVALGIWLIIEAFIHEGRGRVLWPALIGVVYLVILGATLNSLRGRASKMLQGRCPNPMCHGTVHHSERARKGYLICPTCKSTWPEVPGIKYRASGREEAH